MSGKRIAVLCLGLLSVAFAANGYVTVRGKMVGVRADKGIDYISLARVVEAAGGRAWRVGERFFAVVPPETTAVPRPESTPPLPRQADVELSFWADSNIAIGPAGEVVMPARPLVEDDQLFVPLAGLAVLLPELGRDLPALTGAAVTRTGDTVRVRFSFAGGRVASWSGEAKSSLEYRLALAASCDSAVQQQLALGLLTAGGGILRQVTFEPGGGPIMRFEFAAPASCQPVADDTSLVVRAWPRPTRKLRRILLDPGHGGRDPGAVGRAGTEEKGIVLDIAQRLKTRLELDGFEITMTRAADESVALGQRSKQANGQKAELFISVHANASPNRKACGFETYFLSEEKSDWERSVAARENASLEVESGDTLGMSDELALILTDLAQNEYLVESSELAAKIQEKAVPHARVANRGVRQANFYVLRCNYMPAVLVECGFLSNRAEEKLLRDPKHRQRLAEGIALGIVEFVKTYELKRNGS